MQCWQMEGKKKTTLGFAPTELASNRKKNVENLWDYIMYARVKPTFSTFLNIIHVLFVILQFEGKLEWVK